MNDNETIEKWAARVAPMLDGYGWSVTNSSSYCDRWVEAVTPYPPGYSITQLKRALMDYRDAIANGPFGREIARVLESHRG